MVDYNLLVYSFGCNTVGKMIAGFVLDVVYVIFCFFSIGLASTPPKSVNLALETSFLFEPRDVEENTTMLNSVRQFLDNLENLLTPDSRPYFRTLNGTTGYAKNASYIENDKTLTDFLTKLGGIVINYDEEDVKKLAAALNDEVYRIMANSRYNDIFHDALIKIFISNTVKEWTTADPLRLKVEIAKYLTSDEWSAFVNFFRNLNQFFKADKLKLNKLLKKFTKARKTKGFAKPVQKTFDVILDRYGKLDDGGKNRFREELDTLTKYVGINYKHRLNVANTFRRIFNNMDSTTVRDLPESVKEGFSNSDNNIETVNNVNEIRVDKDVQVNIALNTDNNN